MSTAETQRMDGDGDVERDPHARHNDWTDAAPCVIVKPVGISSDGIEFADVTAHRHAPA
jgi:hypothetical protein